MDTDVDAASAARCGRATALVVALCLLVIVVDAFDMLVIVLTAPAIAADWALPAACLGPAFPVGIVGTIGGSVRIASAVSGR